MGPRNNRFMAKTALVILSILLAGCGQLARDGFSDSVNFDRLYAKTVQQIIDEKTDPALVALWMEHHVRYSATDVLPEDEFRPPDVTLLLGYGDCDDFARLAEYIFDSQGITASCLVFSTQYSSHAICYTECGIMSNYEWYPIKVSKQEAKIVYDDNAWFVQEFNFY